MDIWLTYMYPNCKMDGNTKHCHCLNTSQGFTIGLKVYYKPNSRLKTDNQPKLSCLALDPVVVFCCLDAGNIQSV